jgi:GntR family transcriptional regulator
MNPSGLASLPRGLLTDDALPLYGRTAARLWDEVLASHAQTGDRLPSERALALRYEVSRVTLRAALTELENRDKVRSSPARGWFIADVGRSNVERPTSHTVQGFADYALEHGLVTRSRVLESTVRPTSVAEAETLRVAPGTGLFEMRRVRYLDGLVVVLEHNRVPLTLCPALADTDFTTASLFATLRAASPPQLPRTAQYSVEARHPNAQELALLEVDESIPMLVATQMALNQDGRPLEWTVATYRGDRYRFRASITG